MITVDMVREIARGLPRSYEVVVHDRIKFRVGTIVWLAFSRDEQIVGFAFPKEERAAMVASRPDTFVMPGQSDLRFNWIEARVTALDADEFRELVIEAWCMVVPKKVSNAYLTGERRSPEAT